MKVNGYTIHPIALAPHGPMAQITQHTNSEAHDRLLIADMATTDEGAHTPAASVQIFGRSALLSLRDKLVEIYPDEVPPKEDPLVEVAPRMLAALKRAAHILAEIDQSTAPAVLALRTEIVAVIKEVQPEYYGGQEGGAA